MTNKGWYAIKERNQSKPTYLTILNMDCPIVVFMNKWLRVSFFKIYVNCYTNMNFNKSSSEPGLTCILRSSSYSYHIPILWEYLLKNKRNWVVFINVLDNYLHLKDVLFGFMIYLISVTASFIPRVAFENL